MGLWIFQAFSIHMCMTKLWLCCKPPLILCNEHFQFIIILYVVYCNVLWELALGAMGTASCVYCMLWTAMYCEEYHIMSWALLCVMAIAASYAVCYVLLHVCTVGIASYNLLYAAYSHMFCTKGAVYCCMFMSWALLFKYCMLCMCCRNFVPCALLPHIL